MRIHVFPEDDELVDAPKSAGIENLKDNFVAEKVGVVATLD